MKISRKNYQYLLFKAGDEGNITKDLKINFLNTVEKTNPIFCLPNHNDLFTFAQYNNEKAEKRLILNF